jgi:uncharacterized protein (DUF1800 family)
MNDISCPSTRSLSSVLAHRVKAYWAFGGLIGLALFAASTQAQVSPVSTPESKATWRVLSRLGYGPNASLVQAVSAAGGAKPWALAQLDVAYLASQKPPIIPGAWAEFNAALPATFKAFQQERELRRAGQEKLAKPQDGAASMAQDLGTQPQTFSRDLARQAAAWRLAACSQSEVENPVLARMTEFWFNHLTVYVGKGAVRPFVGHYDVNVIRAHALGRFEDLLLASAQHPAMLFYLDQAQSVAPGSGGARGPARGLNENYARELMELHTLGVNGGYTQNDVRELARVLTGWTVNPKDDSGFRFAPRLHDAGEKHVLGRTFNERGATAGVAQGVEAIRMLARHPATAHRIALRLAQFFVSDEPPPALVDRLTQSFLASTGDMRVVLRSLIESPEFWQADQQLFKTPLDYACSALTATHVAGQPPDKTTLRDIAQTLGFLSNAGQAMHGWQTPDGYKTDAATWLAPEALTRRADFALTLARHSSEPEWLKPFLSTATLQNIAKEAPPLHAGLMLASPDFMYK